MESAAIDYAMKALYLVLMLSMPPIIVASLIGILLSLIQAITQLQEQTLTFGVKLLAVVLTLFIMGGLAQRRNSPLRRRYFQPFLYDTLIGRGPGKARGEECGKNTRRPTASPDGTLQSGRHPPRRLHLDYQALFNELHLFEQLLALLVGMPRLFMLVQVAPFMGGNILTGQLRTTVVFACYLVLHPAIVASLPETQGLSPSTFALYGAILVKETLIGMLLGYLSGMLFWTIQCAGFFIDNQRGASMAEGADPLSGEQTSPLGSFFFQSAVYLFFSTGAFLALLGVVYASYEIWPVTQLIPLSVFKDIHLPLFFAGRVSWLLLMMLLLSGPIVVACLLTDVSLGLINRFASQLNVYVLAMPIKSGVAAFLMLFYFMMLLSNATGLFDGVKADFEQLRRLLP